MTFDEFEQACTGAKEGGTAVSFPCPIVIGDGDPSGGIGDSINHQIVVFKLKPDNARLSAIYAEVRFTYDAESDQTVITPITTGA